MRSCMPSSRRAERAENEVKEAGNRNASCSGSAHGLVHAVDYMQLSFKLREGHGLAESGIFAVSFSFPWFFSLHAEFCPRRVRSLVDVHNHQSCLLRPRSDESGEKHASTTEAILRHRLEVKQYSTGKFRGSPALYPSSPPTT
jgi:hypothetical protein